jgi:hypothetical protein
MDDIWVIWEDGNAWLLRNGKIDWDISREVNAQELSMIKLFHHGGGALGGPGITTTTAP